MKLTPKTIDHAQAPIPPQKVRRLTDGHGLYLAVMPDGAKYWRYDYTYAGRRKTLSFGPYPNVGLKDARDAHLEAWRAVKAGQDPSIERRRVKAGAAGASFETIAREFLEKKGRRLDAGTHAAMTARVETHLLPRLGGMPITSVTAVDLWTILEPIEKAGKHHTAHRIHQHAGQIIRYAVRTGRLEDDVTATLRGALDPLKQKNYARLKRPDEIGALLYAIDETPGITPVVRSAMQLMPYVFLRSAELREAEWSEIDLAGAVWLIAPERMKQTNATGEDPEPHHVPLARQAVRILEDLKARTGDGRLVFPSLRTTKRAISNMTLTAALRRLGYAGDQMQIHGWRGIASTRLREKPLEFPNDAIELQLAHKTFRGPVRAAYDDAELLETRRTMMQTYADYLDGLKASAARPATAHT